MQRTDSNHQSDKTQQEKGTASTENSPIENHSSSSGTVPGQLNAESILQLQRTIGNQRVMRKLDTVQRYGDDDDLGQPAFYSDPIIPYQNPLHERKKPGSGESITISPEAFYAAKISDQRKALYNSSVGDSLKNLIESLKEDAQEWKKFRNGQYDMEIIPGTRSANAADEFRNAVIYSWSNDFESPAIRRLGFSFYASYLRRQLTGTELGLIEQMNRFNTTIPGTPTVELKSVLGIKADPVQHEYKMQVVSTSGGKMGAILQGGIFIRKIRIFYSNDVGMSYTTEIKVGTIHASANVEGSFDRKKSGKTKGSKSEELFKKDGEIGDIGGALDMMGLGSEESDAQKVDRVPGPNEWWTPEEFSTGMTIFKIAGNVGGNIGAAKLSIIDESLAEIFMFESDGKTLAFDNASIKQKMDQKDEEARAAGEQLIEFLKKTKYSHEHLEDGDDPTTAKIGAGASIEWEGGYVYDNKVLDKSANDKVEPAEERQFGEWVSINEASVHFDTGSSKLSAEYFHILRKLARQAAAHDEKYPGSEFLFDIVGYASPRWDHTKGKNAESLNYQLSNERAHDVRNKLEQYRRAEKNSDFVCTYDEMGELSSLDSEYDDVVDAYGSSDALQAGSDPDSDDIEDRRVDISLLVYYNFTELYK